jgi:hypothetical protein
MYPGVALKIMRMFRCETIEGESWLVADMRLRCYSGDWFGYALFALTFGVVYVVGLPIGVFVILFRRRRALFASDSGAPGSGSSVVSDDDSEVAQNRASYGFLYEVYGPSAWWWEVEELVRKLLLSAVVVLIEPRSPLQVCLLCLLCLSVCLSALSALSVRMSVCLCLCPSSSQVSVLTG